MWKIKCSGTYFTQGQHGKDITDFDFEKEIPSCPELWIDSVVQKRMLPIWIEEERKKPKGKDKYKRFDGIDSCQIFEFEEIDETDSFIGKDVLNMDEKQIQEVASALVLIEVPLPRKLNIKQLRNECVLAYLSVVQKVEMKKESNKEALDFYKKTPSGTWVVDFSGQSCIIEEVVHPADKHKVVTKIEQKSLSDLMGVSKAPSEEELLAT